MKIIIWLFLGFIYLCSNSMFAQDAPVSAIGTVESTGFSVSVPITATGINNIGSCNLQLLYDPNIIHCTSVEKATQLGGGLATNLEVPGVITVGWYTWPGVTLPDNTEIFILTFSKISGGISIISWNNDYPDRQWSDGNSYSLNDQPSENYYLSGSLNFEEDAPVTTFPVLTFCSGLPIDVPVTVENFIAIGALSLTLQFNADVLSYQSYTNNSDFPGLAVFSPGAGIITAAGFATSSGITLPDNGILFTLHFTTLEGISEIYWVDDGVSCEYTGPPPTYNVLNDVPQEVFYVNGSVIIYSAPNIISQPVSPDTVNAGSGTATFNVVASGDELGYQWQEFTNTWSDLDDGGFYTGVLTPELSIVNPPLTMNGNKYRCIVTGFCAPEAITDGLATLAVTDYSGFNSYLLNEKLFLKSSPNPFRDEMIICYHLPYTGEVKIDILDLSGSLKMTIFESNRTTGDHSVRINTNQLLPGLYLTRIRLYSNNHEVSGLIKIVKLE